jgi:hypothetical protein
MVTGQRQLSSILDATHKGNSLLVQHVSQRTVAICKVASPMPLLLLEMWYTQTMELSLAARDTQQMRDITLIALHTGVNAPVLVIGRRRKNVFVSIAVLHLP